MARAIGNGLRLLALAITLTLLLSGMTADTTLARAPSTPQRQFDQTCRNTGGTVSHVEIDDTHSSQCTHIVGNKLVEVACDFYGGLVWVCTGQTRPLSN